MLHYYKLYWLNAFKINGRARRKEFWFPVLATIIITLIASIVNSLLPIPSWLSYTVATIFSIADYIPSFTVAVRRFHDVGMTMKVPIIFFVVLLIGDVGNFLPHKIVDINFNGTTNTTTSVICIVIAALFLILWIFTIAVCATRGNEEPNKYGENPKYSN